MFIEFQHPIIDVRCLVEENFKIPVPNWPIPEDKKMLKGIGITKRRQNGGSIYWSGEQKYCQAEKAIRFQNLDKYKIRFKNNAILSTECEFRRINSDGNFLVKYEIGFSNSFEKYFSTISENNDYFQKLLLEYCSINVIINNLLGTKSLSTISSCGKALSELYLYSTTRHQALINAQIENWWVSCGEPLCIVEFSDIENDSQLPKHAKLIKKYDNQKIELYHYWLKLTNIDNIRIWIIKILDSCYYDREFVRNLRLNLLRINAEKETLRKIISLILKFNETLTNTDDKKNKLNNYLENITSKILKTERYDIEQKDLLSIALISEDIALPGELESYLEAIKPLENKYITKNIGTIMNGGVVINVSGGNVEKIDVTEKGNIINYGNND